MSFDECVDEYFSQAEKQKEVNKNQSKESAIWSKMNKIKQDQEMIKTFMVYFECNNGYDSRDDIVDMLMQ